MILSLFLSYSRKAILHSSVCIYLLQVRLCTTGRRWGGEQDWFGSSERFTEKTAWVGSSDIL